MRIIRERATGRVIYSGDVRLTSRGVIAPKFSDYTAKPDRVEEVLVDSLPPGFRNGEWLHDGENWSLDPLAADEVQAREAQALQQMIVGATQVRLDGFAQTRGYDGILAACTYATSVIPQFQKEGQYAVSLRDATWAKLYEIQAEVVAGTRPAPQGIDDVVGELPEMVWPE